MSEILLKIASLVLLIVLGYSLKSMGLFGEKDYKVLTTIIMNITLPSAVIVSFSTLKFEFSLFFLIALGFICNLVLMLIGYLYSKNKSKNSKIFSMINLSGYNIGAFAIPYIQSFLGASSVAIACMFDVGNALLCTGVTYAIADSIVSDGRKFSLKNFLGKLFSSTTFDVYILLTIITIMGIKVPQAIVTVVTPAAQANAAVAMLALGLMFKWNPAPEYLKSAVCVVAIRTLLAAVTALLIFNFSPFTYEVKKVVSIIVFAPIPVMSPIFTGKCGGDVGLAGFTNSLSIAVGITMITILLFAL